MTHPVHSFGAYLIKFLFSFRFSEIILLNDHEASIIAYVGGTTHVV